MWAWLGYNTNNYSCAGVNGIVFPWREFHGGSCWEFALCAQYQRSRSRFWNRKYQYLRPGEEQQWYREGRCWRSSTSRVGYTDVNIKKYCDMRTLNSSFWLEGSAIVLSLLAYSIMIGVGVCVFSFLCRSSLSLILFILTGCRAGLKKNSECLYIFQIPPPLEDWLHPLILQNSNTLFRNTSQIKYRAQSILNQCEQLHNQVTYHWIKFHESIP